MNRYTQVLLDIEQQRKIDDLKDVAEEVARILDTVPSREASHALTLLEGAVMFGTRAIAKSV